jgi:hypothetical protein
MKNRMIKISVGILLIGSVAIAGTSQAIEWKYITSDSSGNALYFDPGSVDNHTFDTVNVWVKYNTGFRYKMSDYGYSVSLIKIDCDEGRLASEVIVDFDEEDQFLSSVINPGKPWFSISPGSLYSKLQRTVCPVRFP